MLTNKQTKILGIFSGGPVVRTPCFPCCGPGFNPWSDTKILKAAWHSQKKKKKENLTKNSSKANPKSRHRYRQSGMLKLVN